MLSPGKDAIAHITYERHRPEQTLLYKLVEKHSPDLVEQLDAQGKSLPLHERHLRNVLRGYFDYYNNDRTHLGIEKESSSGRHVSKKTSASDRLVELSRVGGLHHRYEWQEAA